MPLSDADFAFIAREVRERTGLLIEPAHAAAVETKIAPIARREGLISVNELITTARARRDERLLETIAETLTSKDTWFFRDRAPFAYFRKTMVPEILSRRSDGKLRIWCAGCSTGQEPFSLAMTIEEMRNEGRGIDCEIIATDISATALDKASEGLFNQFEVQRGLPIRHLIAYFEKVGDLWRVLDRVRACVKFEQRNILTDPAALGGFDIIFVRNVLNGLAPEQAANALELILGQLAEDGYIVFGDGETPDARFAPATLRGGVFTLKRTAAARAA